MGTLQPKPDETLSVMQIGLAGGTSSDFNADPADTSSEYETSETRVCATDSDKHNKDAQLASDYNEEDFPASPMPRNDGSAVELPPTQVMDRAGDSTSPDPNRIPPHVFDRTKSAAPEWSVASNESLFSIHMGTMSFTRDQINWMSKSGELGFPSDSQSQFYGQSIEIPGTPPRPPPSTNKSTESSIKTCNGNQGLGSAEAAAAETMREVIREYAGDNIDQEKKPPPPKSDPRAIALKHSDDSSIKSFAFPILTGEEDKSGSLSAEKGKRRKENSLPQTPKTAAESKALEPESEPEASKPHTPKATKNSGHGRWFSCFSCCPLCS